MSTQLPLSRHRESLRGRISRITDPLDKPLLLILLLIFGTSVVAMISAGHEITGLLQNHIRNLLIAGALALTLGQFGPGQFQRLALPVYLLALVLLLGVELFGQTVNGSTRWLLLGPLRLQPSELMKIALPLAVAWMVQLREGSFSSRDWVVHGAMILLPVALILRQPDLGTSLLVAAAGIYVLLLSGLPVRLIIMGAVLGAVPVLSLVFFGDALCAEGVDWPALHSYQQERVCTLLDPYRDPLGKGFHTIQSTIAIGSGGIWGRGLLNGTQSQLAFIPERETDFIFSGFAEEFGLIGGLWLLVLYAALTLRGLWIALGARTLFGRLLASSLSLVLFTYAFVNLGMVSGVLPVVGVPLPFISYGGSAQITLGVGVGILLSVARDRSALTQGFSMQR